MIGSPLWEPGEFTDDTQMAILEAESLVACAGIDDADLFDRFRRWAASGPKDVGIMTSTVLSHHDPAQAAAAFYAANPDGAAGNGSLMRAGFAAARWMFGYSSGTGEVARRLSRVTHADPAAQEGRALFHILCQKLFFTGEWPSDTEPLITCLHPDHREHYRALIGDDPPMVLGNGTVWGCLRDAVRAVRHSDDFEGAMRNALDVGNDVDTVAAVAGGLAGVLYGLDDIPRRWTESLHGTVLGRTYRTPDLLDLYDRLRLAHFGP
jgi:ADP-ribosylglycohydrolase